MSGITDEAQLMRELFNEIDEDGSGTIDKSELRAFLNCILSLGFNEANFAQLFKESDEDESGEVDFDEFIQVLNVVCTDMPTNEIMDLFQEERDRRRKEHADRKARFEKKDSEPPPLIKRGKAGVKKRDGEDAGGDEASKKELEDALARIKALEEENKRLAEEAAAAKKAAEEAAAAAAAAASSSSSANPECEKKCEAAKAENARMKSEYESEISSLKRDLRAAEEQARSAAASASSSSKQSGPTAEEYTQLQTELMKAKSEAQSAKDALQRERESRSGGGASPRVRGNTAGNSAIGAGSGGVRVESDAPRRTRAFYRWLQNESIRVNANSPIYSPRSARSRSPPHRM